MRYSTVKATEKNRFPVSVIIAAVIATVLFMFIVFSFVEISEMSSEISDMKHSISALSDDQVTMQGQIDYRYTKSEIDSTSSSLGLSQSKNTTVYFSGEDSEDVSEVIQPETTLGGAIDSLLSAIGKNFRKLIDFLN